MGFLISLSNVEYTKNQYSEVTPLTDAVNVSFVAGNSNIFELTTVSGVGPGATRELENPTDLEKGMTWQVWFTQDSAGGRALTFDTFYDWGDEGAPDFSTQASGIINIISCAALSTTKIAATALKGFGA